MSNSGRSEEASSSTMKVVAESTLGSGLLMAMVSKQNCLDNNMLQEAAIFEEAIQRARTELTQAGLDPDVVIKRR